MTFSFQTVWIIFGVTLVHLFAISALSPTGGARRDAVSKPDPAVLSEKKIESAVIIADSSATTSVPIGTTEVSPQNENEEAQGAAAANNLLEVGPGQDVPLAVDPPALPSPPQRIREIRDLEPMRRS